MAMSEIFKYIKIKNNIVQSCLITSISVVSILIVLYRKNRKKQNVNDYHNGNENNVSTPLIVVTGCDTGLGYSIVMKYLSGTHNLHQNNNKVYNFPLFNHNKLTIPSKFAIIAFCLNPNGIGAKCLFQKSLNNTNIQLFIRQLDLTDKCSIENGVTFITDLLQQSYDENKHNNYGKLWILYICIL